MQVKDRRVTQPAATLERIKHGEVFTYPNELEDYEAEEPDEDDNYLYVFMKISSKPTNKKQAAASRDKTQVVRLNDGQIEFEPNERIVIPLKAHIVLE